MFGFFLNKVKKKRIPIVTMFLTPIFVIPFGQKGAACRTSDTAKAVASDAESSDFDAKVQKNVENIYHIIYYMCRRAEHCDAFA